MEDISQIKKLLEKYSMANESGDKDKRDMLYQKIIELERKLRSNISLLPKDLRKEARLTLDEIAITIDNNAIQKEKLFAKSKNPTKIKRYEPSTNDQYLEESKKISKKTTQILTESMVDIDKSLDIGKAGLEIIVEDNKKISNVSENLDKIQEESSIGLKILTRFTKRLYTDKIIMLGVCMIICLIVLIILFKYNII